MTLRPSAKSRTGCANGLAGNARTLSILATSPTHAAQKCFSHSGCGSGASSAIRISTFTWCVEIDGAGRCPVIKYQEFIPHTVLQDNVKRFWILEKEYTAEDSVEEVLPDACIELILNFGSSYVQVDGTKRLELRKFL